MKRQSFKSIKSSIPIIFSTFFQHHQTFLLFQHKKLPKCHILLTFYYLKFRPKNQFHNIMLRQITKFSCSTLKVPTIDITNFLQRNVGWENDCKLVAESFKTYGLVIIKDPRVKQHHNDEFLNLMERYFYKRSRQFQQGETTLDFSPLTNYRVGIMHEYQEKFQNYEKEKKALRHPHHSLTPLETQRDPKWRYMWKVNYSQNVIPKDFPEFQQTMNAWGQHMKNGSLTIAEMAARGLGLEPDFLTRTIINSDFMLAPTAADLEKTKVGDILAAFHRDFDLLTIHGKSRYPGLFAWLSTGQKFLVRVPEGQLLIQAGKQLQWYTGGHIKAGFYEVVHTEEVERIKKKAIAEKRIPWRISSSMFCHVQDDLILEPHQLFQTAESLEAYPTIRAEDYLNNELYNLTEVQ